VAAWEGPGAESLAVASRILAEGRIEMLGRAFSLGEVDWTSADGSLLLAYHLHYFDFAPALARAYRSTSDDRFAGTLAEVAARWIESTTGAEGPGWHPYPTSLRIANWIEALALCRHACPPAAVLAMEASLGTQLDLLSRRLEHHLQANHLFRNYRALVLGGLYFRGDAAERWLRTGLRGVVRELGRQVLPDGCHFERSPAYHAILLGDLLEMIDLLDGAGEEVPAEIPESARRMVRALRTLTRTDGSLHLFNDSAAGMGPEVPYLEQLARRVIGVRPDRSDGMLELPAAGYHGWASAGGATRIVIDCGAPGPRHQPGHAHCDLLSFELDLAGVPVVVDSGVSGYADDPLREYQRSTRAHSTVTIGGRDQSEVWGAFRMGRFAKVREAAPEACGAGGYRFNGACSPFHDRHVVHRREIQVDDRRCTIRDRIAGRPRGPVRSYLHLHPDRMPRPTDTGWTIDLGGRSGTVQAFGGAAPVLRSGETDPPQGWFAPAFGHARPAPVLELTALEPGSTEFGFTIEIHAT
jgi:uncharacterized heparinase superfamily protein